MATTRIKPVSTDQPPPRIATLHVADRRFFARFGRMFRQIALALGEHNVANSLVTDDSRAAADADAALVDAQVVPRLSGWKAWRLSHYLQRRFTPAPTMIHVWSMAALSHVHGWAQRDGLPVIVHVLGVNDVDHLRRRGPKPNEVYLSACEELDHRLREAWPNYHEPTFVVPPGLLMSRLPVRPISTETLAVMWSGRFEEECGVEILLDAIHEVRRQDGDVQVALIGRGPRVPEAWRRARQLGVHECVTIIDVPILWDDALTGADIYVQPTSQRRLALAPLLAMAMGKVVLAARDQVAPWFVEGETCWQFTPGSAVELAYQLQRVVTQRKDAQALAQTAREHARAHHAVSDVGEELVGIYRRVLNAISAAPEPAP